ncbi:MAG: hypothetical protein KA004_03610 [Verrucomicrobiales bacterium]|nr:hypothetical protein [Verrucomicrobiales bacterium]
MSINSPFFRLAAWLQALAFGAAWQCAAAQDSPSAAKEGAGELDLSTFPGQVIDDVVVPVPSEIFGVLDKLGDPDWKKEVNTDPRPNFVERADVALLLGAVVADGFIAVQAEDEKTVEKIGREVLDLAKALGVKDSVIEHCNAIQEAAKANEWDTVRRELDVTQKTVRDRMEKMKDGALAECISVGGWLRGTQVVTSIIGKNFSQDKAELLNQPDLTDYFRDNVEEAITRVKKPDKLKLISSGLAQIHEIMLKEGENIPQDSVAVIQRITSALVIRITTKE